MRPRFHIPSSWKTAPLHQRALSCGRCVLDAYYRYWCDRLGVRPDPRELLPIDVELILTEIGWRVDYYEALADEAYRVAGEVAPAEPGDSGRSAVRVATNLPVSSQRFTLAHELGHVLMHDVRRTRYRDPPITGRDIRGEGRLRHRSDPDEREANRFAAFLLMPRKSVLWEFRARFGVGRIRIADTDEALLLQFGAKHFTEFVRDDPRGIQPFDLATALAAATHFDGRHFTECLAARFGVSNHAMAAQLVDLGLVTL